MKKLAAFLMIVSVSLFSVTGCSKTKKTGNGGDNGENKQNDGGNGDGNGS